MKRFLQNTYSWLSTLLLTVMFAISGSIQANDDITAVEMPLGQGTYKDISYYCGDSDNTGTYARLWGSNGPSDLYGNIKLTCITKFIVKVEMYCQATDEFSPLQENITTIIENQDKQGKISVSGNVATWEGKANSICFTARGSIEVTKYIVYLQEGEIAKECTIGIDHYADNANPGKKEEIPSSITLYMQANAATTSYTGLPNCPEGVTFTSETGLNIPVSMFNYWTGLDQLSIVLGEKVTEYGTYTLHIPEGLVFFQGNKFNKEINVSWTLVAPDLREKKSFKFDYTTEDFATEVEGITFESTGTFNKTAAAVRFSAGNTLSFTAPEGTSIVKVELGETGKFKQNGLSKLTTDPEGNGSTTISSDNSIFTWTGDEQTINFKAEASFCLTEATVTLAYNESGEGGEGGEEGGEGGEEGGEGGEEGGEGGDNNPDLPNVGWDPAVEPVVEATVADGLAEMTITFPEANKVESSEYGVIAGIFDANGECTGIVFDGVIGDVVTYGTDCVSLKFADFAALTAETKAEARSIAAKVAAAASGSVSDKVVVLANSFKIDGTKYYDKTIVRQATTESGLVTGIHTATTECSIEAYDLQGRRIDLSKSGLIIVGGKKVIK